MKVFEKMGKGESAGYQFFNQLTLSSIYTHFNTLKEKHEENIVGNGEISQNEQFHLFPQCFLCNLYLKIL